MIRWAQVQADFGDRWQPRAELAAEWLAGANSVADLGCGSMNLERCLRPGQSYVPVDVARRDERTIILDFNRAPDLARLPPADACALLGVLEYCYEPSGLLRALRGTYRQVIATFNAGHAAESLEMRLGHGWVNHYSHGELLELFADHGFAVSREHLFEGRRREYLFDLR